MRGVLPTILTLLLALTALSATVSAEEPRTPPPPPPPYYVIVHPKNPITRVDRAFLEDAFLKKSRRWPHDSVIHPVDLVPASAVRGRFSKDVIGRSIAAVKAYWQQQIFSGRDVPPPELEGDEKVVAYVLKHEGAVAYVSGSANLRDAKAVRVSR